MKIAFGREIKVNLSNQEKLMKVNESVMKASTNPTAEGRQVDTGEDNHRVVLRWGTLPGTSSVGCTSPAAEVGQSYMSFEP